MTLLMLYVLCLFALTVLTWATGKKMWDFTHAANLFVRQSLGKAYAWAFLGWACAWVLCASMVLVLFGAPK